MHFCIFISVINQLDAQNFCFTISYAPTRPQPVTRLPLAPPLACQKPVRYKYTTRRIPCHISSTCLWRRNWESVPKRRLLKLRHRGITQKKTYYMLGHVEVMSIQLFNLLERYYVYLHLWWAHVLETCRGMKWNLFWNKFCTSIWLNTEININTVV